MWLIFNRPASNKISRRNSNSKLLETEITTTITTTSESNEVIPTTSTSSFSITTATTTTTAKLDFSTAPGVEKLSVKEIEFCELIGLLPNYYLTIKAMIVREAYRNGQLTKDGIYRTIKVSRLISLQN